MHGNLHPSARLRILRSASRMGIRSAFFMSATTVQALTWSTPTNFSVSFRGSMQIEIILGLELAWPLCSALFANTGDESGLSPRLARAALSILYCNRKLHISQGRRSQSHSSFSHLARGG